MSNNSTETKLRTALTQLLSVINEDKDGSYFICKEARDAIVQANMALEDEEGEVPPSKPLTVTQQYVVSTLNYRNARFTAHCFEEAWKQGKTHYIDARNGAGRGLIRAIDKGNKEALEN